MSASKRKESARAILVVMLLAVAAATAASHKSNPSGPHVSMEIGTRDRNATVNQSASSRLLRGLHFSNQSVGNGAAPTTTNATTVGNNNNDAPPVTVEMKIVGGTPAASSLGGIRKFPFFVQGFGCGATLVHDDVVLTAAHCNGAFWEEVVVGPGGPGGEWGQRRKITSSMLPHPDFNLDTMENDVMLFKVQPVTLQKLKRALARNPVRLNSDPRLPSGANEALVVVGFGAQQEGGDQSSELREATVPYVPTLTCQESYPDSIIPTKQLCAGGGPNGIDSCQGDSGGPILADGNVLVGVVSWGYGCGRPNYPGVYARISGLHEWIRQGICDLSDTPPKYC